MPEQKEDHLPSAIRLLERRREFSEVKQALATKKEEFQLKMERLKQRRVELERKELQFKESREKFDKFLQENDQKKNRAIKKAKEERIIKKEKDKEIEILLEECENLNMECKRTKKKQDAYMMYNAFMLKTLSATKEFNETRDIIARYETLKSTYNDLWEANQINQEMIENIKQNDARKTQEKNNEILGYDKQLSTLLMSLETCQNEALFLESKWSHIWKTTSQAAAKSQQIKMATLNMFNVIKAHQRKLTPEDITTLQQLDHIRIFGEDLITITKTISNPEHHRQEEISVAR